MMCPCIFMLFKYCSTASIIPEAERVCASANTEDGSSRPRTASQPAAKAAQTSLFSSYDRRREQTSNLSVRAAVTCYLKLVDSTLIQSTGDGWKTATTSTCFVTIESFLQSVFVFRQHLLQLNLSSAIEAFLRVRNTQERATERRPIWSSSRCNNIDEQCNCWQ